jgi:hypothetical protein
MLMGKTVSQFLVLFSVWFYTRILNQNVVKELGVCLLITSKDEIKETIKIKPIHYSGLVLRLNKKYSIEETILFVRNITRRKLGML